MESDPRALIFFFKYKYCIINYSYHSLHYIPKTYLIPESLFFSPYSPVSPIPTSSLCDHQSILSVCESGLRFHTEMRSCSICLSRIDFIQPNALKVLPCFYR